MPEQPVTLEDGIARRHEDWDWAYQRVTDLCANALIDASRLGRKILKGFGYPNEIFRAAQDHRALSILLAEVSRLAAALAEQEQKLDARERAVMREAASASAWREQFYNASARAEKAEASLAAQAQEIGQLRLERDSAREQFDKHIEWASDQLAVLTKERDALKAEKGWQPIETAPTYRAVLVYVPNREHYGPAVYRALLGEFGWTSTGLACGRAIGADSQPTHWMPLPAPPVLSSADPEAK